MKTLHDKTALVTGAAGGIGAALARALAAEGCHLALTDVDAGRLEALAATLPAGRRVTVHALDVRDRHAWEALRDDVARAHGGLDVLIHNAGVTVHAPFAEQTLDDVDWLLDVNLRGPLVGTHTLLPLLAAAPEAHVVLVASMAALFGVPLQTTYGASKAALRGFGAALRVELSDRGIGVTTVLPGTIATPFMTRARSYDAAESGWMAEAMLARGTSPDTVARKVLRAVRANRGELTVGPDALAVSVVQRLCPRLLPFLLTLGWRQHARARAAR